MTGFLSRAGSIQRTRISFACRVVVQLCQDTTDTTHLPMILLLPLFHNQSKESDPILGLLDGNDDLLLPNAHASSFFCDDVVYHDL
jgi:hypothetical protein